MGLIAENHIEISEDLFWEGMGVVTGARKDKSGRNWAYVLAGILVIVVAVTLYLGGNFFNVIGEVVVFGALGFWLCFYMPRKRRNQAYSAMERKDGGFISRTIRLYEDYLEIIPDYAERKIIEYDTVLRTARSEHLLVLICENNGGVLLALDGFTKGSPEAVEQAIADFREEWEDEDED